jgi:hypothetical protein
MSKLGHVVVTMDFFGAFNKQPEHSNLLIYSSSFPKQGDAFSLFDDAVEADADRREERALCRVYFQCPAMWS